MVVVFYGDIPSVRDDWKEGKEWKVEGKKYTSDYGHEGSDGGGGTGIARDW
jgi:hypothetical protein